MDLEVLVSTMGINTDIENKKLIDKMQITGRSLTISQTNKESKGYGKNRIIYSKEKGLSKSRNLAIDNADADIILLADDDVIYNKDYEKIIIDEYQKNPNADMIAFYVKSRNPERKVRKLKTGKIKWIKIFKISSFQLSFKLYSIKDLKFDENFGAGTRNFCGEETIFLGDCLKKGLNLMYIDKEIGEVEQKESTWYRGINKDFFKVEKKCFKRIFSNCWWILWVPFVLKKKIQKIIKTILTR